MRNDVSLVGLNHKMGYRGTVNTVLYFGEGTHRPDGAAGAIGYLVGQQNLGLAAMFHMMNEARIAVGAGAARSATCTRSTMPGSVRRAGRSAAKILSRRKSRSSRTPMSGAC
jgi:alkylation response protein AidB-like acyl-CoA dehydrogenase